MHAVVGALAMGAVTSSINAQCSITCPPGASAEPEACGARLNDGCNMTVPTYSQIFCGMTICGTSWAEGGDRDTDWYTFNVSDTNGDGVARINATLSSEFPSLLFILNSDCGNIVAHAMDQTDNCQSTTISACVPAPGTYRVFVSPGTADAAIYEGIPCGAGGQYALTVTCEDLCLPPTNDLCINARTIDDGSSFIDTQTATTDGPAHAACDPFGTGDTQVHNDVWYKYTATCTGDLIVDVCNSVNYNSKIAVYDGCACPVSDVDLLACNDDLFECQGGSSALFAPVVAGQCYLIRVGGVAGEFGIGTIRLNCFPNGLCPDTGDCSVANGSPSCDDQYCCETVCEFDQYCCLVDWDDQCAQEAAQLCTGSPPQACCLSPGACVMLSPEECLSFGASPQGDGTSCGGTVTCFPEACCFADDSCQNLTRDECLAAGGTPNGPTTDCATSSCTPPREACCLTEDVCINLEPSDCLAQGSQPKGPGTDCSTVSCFITCPSDIAPLVAPDGMVDVLDLLDMLANWGPCQQPCSADIVQDGVINVTDLISILSAWGPCP